MSTVANNFWGKDDAGVSPLLDRMHHAKLTSDELKSFYGSMSLSAYIFTVFKLNSSPQLELPLKRTMHANFCN